MLNYEVQQAFLHVQRGRCDTFRAHLCSSSNSNIRHIPEERGSFGYSFGPKWIQNLLFIENGFQRMLMDQRDTLTPQPSLEGEVMLCPLQYLKLAFRLQCAGVTGESSLCNELRYC